MSRRRSPTRSSADTRILTPRFTFFAGKGGVGKTTCAAARAIAAASAGARVLAVSTDPAHSLGDALRMRLSARPAVVSLPRRRGAGALRAVELDAPRAFARWIARHRQALGDILEHGTWLDRHDVDLLIGLPMPGVDELAGFLEIIALAERASDDLIVVDTAPTGHMLRLIGAPDAVASVADVFARLQREHRLIRAQLAGVGRPEAADRLIEQLADGAAATGRLLRDAARTTFEWVLLPEALSVDESEDALAALARAGIAVAELIVNRVTPGGPACPVCDRRRAAERATLASLPRRLGRYRTRLVPALGPEPRGVAALAPIGRLLVAPANKLVPRRATTARIGRILVEDGAMAWSAADREADLSPPEAIAALRDTRLLLFGGKGGVGKTTCAAAAALRLARAEPRVSMLLLSTDPAHSLGDVLGLPIGDAPRAVPGAPRNLRVREIDPAAALAVRRRGLEAALDEIAATFGAGALGGGRGAAEVLDLAPPGIDELLGMLSVSESLADGETGAPRPGAAVYDRVIVDTAPTGHALRLLEAPDAAREWVQALLAMLLKYKRVVRPGQLAAELVDLSRSVRRLQALLRRSTDARFIVVTRAAELPRAETDRLLTALDRLRVAAPAVVINAVTLAPGRCPLCRATARKERREVASLVRRARQRRGGCVIIQTPLTAPPPRGVAALDRWAGRWRQA